MRGEEVANAAGAIADNRRRLLARGKENLVVEQKNPILVAGNDSLHQDRVVILRDFTEVFYQRGPVMQGLREVAARSRQRFDESRAAQFRKMRQRILAFVPRRAMGAVPVVQKEVLAAECGDAGLRQNPGREIFVGRQRRGGGVVVRIP